jgi:TatD DNase family protein
MTITDTYPFIFRFDQDRDEMMQRAFQNGVTRFYSCNRLYIYRGHVRLRNKLSDNVFLMMGLHPTYVRKII